MTIFNYIKGKESYSLSVRYSLKICSLIKRNHLGYFLCIILLMPLVITTIITRNKLNKQDISIWCNIFLFSLTFLLLIYFYHFCRLESKNWSFTCPDAIVFNNF